MPDRMDYANEWAKQINEAMKEDLMETPTINDIGIESYHLYVHYKKNNHVLFVGSFTANGWITSLIEGYLVNDSLESLTFTMVEV